MAQPTANPVTHHRTTDGTPDDETGAGVLRRGVDQQMHHER
jgi:hypothetical protein